MMVNWPAGQIRQFLARVGDAQVAILVSVAHN